MFRILCGFAIMFFTFAAFEGGSITEWQLIIGGLIGSLIMLMGARHVKKEESYE